MDKKNIVALFFTSHADTVGNANRLYRLKFLENNYNLTIALY